MYSEDEIEAVACLAITLVKGKQRRQRKKRLWTRSWILNRDKCGAINNLLQELQAEDPAYFKNFLRISADDFDYLLERVRPLITKQDTFMRKAITETARLALTLRYLASGDSYRSLMYLFRIPSNTISQIIPEVCAAIYNVLKKEYLKMPSTEQKWRKIASDFNNKWNFSNCLGALDEKHLHIKAPSNSGSLYFNYKGDHSIVLMALADANYKFIYINVGSPGRDSDGGVFTNCSLARALENNTLNIPNGEPLPGRKTPVQFVIVADDAFAMQSYILKPYAFRNLSRVRRVVENVFGIASARFRILRRSAEIDPSRMKVVTCAIAVLHNFIMSRTKSTTIYAPPGTFDLENEDGTITPGSWRKECQYFQSLQNVARGTKKTAKEVREEYKNYFCREGEVPWQRNYI